MFTGLTTFEASNDIVLRSENLDQYQSSQSMPRFFLRCFKVSIYSTETFH